MLPQFHLPAGDGGALVGDAGGGLAGSGETSQVEGVSLDSLRQGSAAHGADGGGDGSPCAGDEGRTDRSHGRGDGGIEAAGEGTCGDAPTSFPTFPVVLDEASSSLPPAVRISPAVNRFWLLAGDDSEDEGEGATSANSGMTQNPS